MDAPQSPLLYPLGDRRPHARAAFVAFQHVVAMFIGIITPPLPRGRKG